MRLPETTYIASQKLADYLLRQRPEDDKSKFLGSAGYARESWQLLERDLRSQILTLDADEIQHTKHGVVYEIHGHLKGPNGKSLAVVTIWMKETASGQTKFITLYPWKKKA